MLSRQAPCAASAFYFHWAGDGEITRSVEDVQFDLTLHTIDSHVDPQGIIWPNSEQGQCDHHFDQQVIIVFFCSNSEQQG